MARVRSPETDPIEVAVAGQPQAEDQVELGRGPVEGQEVERVFGVVPLLALAHELERQRQGEQGAALVAHSLYSGRSLPSRWRRIAQSRCAHPDGDFARVWMHNEMLQVEGKKMSKSLGNVVDPLLVMDDLGTDALRFTLLTGGTPGNDLNLSLDKVASNRNFANKIWNGFRLVRGWEVSDDLEQPEASKLAIEWYRSKFMSTLKYIDEQFEQYRLSDALTAIYKLIWDDFSSWYLEMVKPAFGAAIDPKTLEATVSIFERLMQVLHPFMPFVTEEVWSWGYARSENAPTIHRAPWPSSSEFSGLPVGEGRGAAAPVAQRRPGRGGWPSPRPRSPPGRSPPSATSQTRCSLLDW